MSVKLDEELRVLQWIRKFLEYEFDTWNSSLEEKREDSLTLRGNMSQNGDAGDDHVHGVEEPEEEDDGTTGAYSKRDQHRAFVAVLKDALHPLNTEAADMKRETDDFFECLESYFEAMGLENLDDGVTLHDKARIRVLKSVLGKKAKDALEGVLEETV
jgi:hypothetical protein